MLPSTPSTSEHSRRVPPVSHHYTTWRVIGTNYTWRLPAMPLCWTRKRGGVPKNRARASAKVLPKFVYPHLDGGFGLCRWLIHGPFTLAGFHKAYTAKSHLGLVGDESCGPLLPALGSQQSSSQRWSMPSSFATLLRLCCPALRCYANCSCGAKQCRARMERDGAMQNQRDGSSRSQRINLLLARRLHQVTAALEPFIITLPLARARATRSTLNVDCKIL
ncbi:hypothetical protein B0H14DRAFT_3129847 [Mycena olivaceomarginata]|nr:hypothetical protein B0H14DRAFT_3129847 [Mycena olivaceomarginata]